MLRLAAPRGLRSRASRRVASICIPISQQRSFFGMGEIVGVLANPAETIRQLKESKELLIKAREESALRNEAKRIPKKHTFSKLPGFHGRETEQALLRKVLAGNPQMNVIFGATSVGKTALLRQVLAGDDYFVIKFDLRISGFADLRSLYLALCEQFKNVFHEMHDEEMDKLAITFKHLTINLNETEEKNPEFKVSVADLADLMETLQSCLLRYWEYDPKVKADEKKKIENEKGGQGKDTEQPSVRKVEIVTSGTGQVGGSSTTTADDTKGKENQDAEDANLFKKRPIVFFMDEAHKLPALVSDQLSLKVFLDTLLVLTKQDRLCHVILSTSDSFFQHFLRSMNVGHHSQIMTVGDCTKEETHAFFTDEIVPLVPENLKQKLDFEEVYEAFGGKLSHIQDYMSVWINAEGGITPFKSAIFTQAYTLLQFHLTHESFDTYSPLSTATAWANADDETQFTRSDLLYVMRKLVSPPYSLPYFDLCRKIGTAQADSMVKTRVLDLRWTRSVSPEQEWIERVWSDDGIERPIVLPMTRIVRKAMEVALREEDKRSELEKEEKGTSGEITEKPKGDLPKEPRKTY